MAKKQIVDISITTKEAAYLFMYYLTGIKKDAYTFAARGDTNTTNENSIKSMATAYHNSNKVKQLEPLIKAKFINQAIKALEAEGYKILDQAEAVKIASNQNETDQNNTIEQLKNRIAELEQERLEGDNLQQNNISDFSDLPELDLSDKDTMLKELNRRYKGVKDDKIRNDISKMIMDVQNMKKDENKEDKQAKIYYMPLRKCPDCPNIHTLYSSNNIDR